MIASSDILQNCALGKPSIHDKAYNPSRLYPILRIKKSAIPWFGCDIWNHYEVSWLNPQGKPIVATAEIIYDCHSPAIIESKSLKLYFNSLNHTVFHDFSEITALVTRDLSHVTGMPVSVRIMPLRDMPSTTMMFDGFCLDEIDIQIDQAAVYNTVNPDFLVCDQYTPAGDTLCVTERLYSHLLRSNCLVTHQPDWGSVQICYTGRKIQHDGLLRYIISYRDHNAFHEQCIEQMFIDISERCAPQVLSIYGRYTRRGGIDINPYRSSSADFIPPHNTRLYRQ